MISPGRHFEGIDVPIESQLLNYISPVNVQKYTLLANSLEKTVLLAGPAASVSSSHLVR